MNRAEAYVKYGTLPFIAATEILPTFKNILKWKDNCKVLDVGCGPGNVTHDLLLPILPKSTKAIIGIDNYNGFIEYAKSHYSNEILSFKAMDIIKDKVPMEYELYFDYVVSFLCFHQFNNHDVAFANVKKMLKPEGEMLLYFPVTSRVFPVYELLSKQTKWKPYFTDYALYCSPYKDSTNIKKDVEQFFTAMGFETLLLNFEERRFKFKLNDVSRLMYTLVPLPIPEHVRSELVEDSVDAFRNLNFVNIDENNEEYLDFVYNLIVLHIKKKT